MKTTAPANRIAVFVYGTLRRGHGNHYLLDAATYAGRHSLPGARMHGLGGFPGVTACEATEPRIGHPGRVFGEVYFVSPATLARLDRLEGHPNWYERRIVGVINEYGESRNAWCYFYLPSMERNPVVESGDWNEYITTPEA